MNIVLAQNVDQLIKNADVERIIRTLSADDMQGRAAFSPGIDKAATFIENEFRQIGLQPLTGETSFRQQFAINHIRPLKTEVTVDGKAVPAENIVVITDKAALNWSSEADAQIIYIKKNEDFQARYRAIRSAHTQAVVFVDQSFESVFSRLRSGMGSGHNADQLNEQDAVVFILSSEGGKAVKVNFANEIETQPLFNVAGMIPGKSKRKEYVVFSAHYDHLGIVKAVGGDSISNGADDDASGVTAMISLANYYKKLNNNERTLLFVAFTAEEIGGLGSQYFSQKLNPDEVVAMFNIEMIGKDSKFGKNTAFITGYERSDFGKILQKNLDGTDFKFYPDPYPQQNLFYRSDNATLAALGVPAHTISTDKIDVDKYYHTVKDEFATLDVNNIVATIKAIALSSRSIVAGTDTPSRIPKLER